MASSLALKKLLSSNLLPYSPRATRQAIPSLQSASRLFTTNAVATRCDQYVGVPLTRSRKVEPESLSEETDDSLYLRMDMPGLEREDVKVIVEQNTLIIKDKTIVEQNTVIVMGERKEKSGAKDSGRRTYTNKIDLPCKLYKTNQIKAEMKNGVLKVVVPKVKEEERSDLFHVKVE